MLRLRCAAPGGTRRSSARGLSMIELMVGVAVAMVVVGGAVSLFVGNLGGSRQLLAETRLNQDLRAAVDVITRDLRRSGYWGNAIQGTIAIGATSATAPNPYSAVSTASASEIAYRYSRDNAENDALDGNEQFGLRLTGGAIEMNTGAGGWTAITDSQSITVTSFTITPTATVVPLGHLCQPVCAAGAPNCPRVIVRKYAVVVQGHAAANASLTRDLRSDVRVRNERVEGACPA